MRMEWVGSSLALYVGTRTIQSLSAHPHSSTASSRLNWQPRWFKWTRPFRWKTESGFCACAITFRTCYTSWGRGNSWLLLNSQLFPRPRLVPHCSYAYNRHSVTVHTAAQFPSAWGTSWGRGNSWLLLNSQLFPRPRLVPHCSYAYNTHSVTVRTAAKFPSAWGTSWGRGNSWLLLNSQLFPRPRLASHCSCAYNRHSVTVRTAAQFPSVWGTNWGRGNSWLFSNSQL